VTCVTAGGDLRRFVRLLLAVVAAATVASGCQLQPQGSLVVDEHGSAPAASIRQSVPLGTGQDVSVASAFGPGQGDVMTGVTVFEVRDRVAPDPRRRPKAAASHWASADVQVCRSAPVVLGYPAWVLGDDDGRTAQAAKESQPQFPQPALAGGPGTSSCRRGWVTFVTPDELHPTKVTFEQAREVPPAWRITAPGGAK